MLGGMDHEDDATGDTPIRGHLRTADVRRVAHGLFLRVNEESEPDLEFLRDLRAWLLVLPRDAVYTHVTAARVRKWQLPALPEQVSVFAATQADTRPRRPGLICSRLLRTTEPIVAVGVPVDSAHETLLRAARDLGLIDLLIMVDSARHLGHVDEAAMGELLKTRRPGVRLLRHAWALSDARSQSAGETLLRLFDIVIEVDVVPQATVYDDAGNPVGTVDLLVEGTGLVHEYDGAHHRRGGQHRTDLRRERGLGGASYERRGFTLDDLVNHPGVVMHEIDRDLGRRHELRRLRRWRRLVENSLYSETGRRRVMNRWHRAMGTSDWAQTS